MCRVAVASAFGEEPVEASGSESWRWASAQGERSAVKTRAATAASPRAERDRKAPPRAEVARLLVIWETGIVAGSSADYRCWHMLGNSRIRRALVFRHGAGALRVAGAIGFAGGALARDRD